MRRTFAVAAFLFACGGGGKTPVAPTTTSNAAPDAPGAPTSTRADAPVQIASGDFHTCALMGDAAVRCWGRNAEGELGDGTTENRSKPTPVKGVSNAKQIAMAAHSTCALLADGTVTCWGGGRIFGEDKQKDKMPPTPIKGIEGAVTIDGGGLLYCALTKAGAVKCWGDDTDLK